MVKRANLKRFAKRRSPYRRRRFASYQRMIYPFCINIVESGSSGITASALSIPTNRPARVQWCSVRFAMKENSNATTFPLMSVAIKDGNGETDSRSPVIIVGPTVQRAFVRAAPGVDFDHFSSSDVVIYFNVANFATSNAMTVVGDVAVQFMYANNPTPIHSIRPLPNLLTPIDHDFELLQMKADDVTVV